MRGTFTIALCLLFAQAAITQHINPKLLNGQWKARWITCPGVPQKDYGVFHFRKQLDLGQQPSRFIVHASGDNRYRLYVNGREVCNGPARGDLYNWYFETVDIAPYLRAGKNVIAALVWNMGDLAPVAQISNQTGFLLQGDTESEEAINTGGSWKVLRDSAYAPCSVDNMQRLRTYMVIGPGDSVLAAQYPWGWETGNYNDANWKNAADAGNAMPFGHGSDNKWTLVPRTIPAMEEKKQPLSVIRRTTGIASTATFEPGKKPLTIPANTRATLLFDQQFETSAYPELLCNGGRNAVIRLSYAESLYDKNNNKGNRNEIEGKELKGNYDVFIPDGGQNRRFRPLWFRTWRYLQVDVETKEEPLAINDLYGITTWYPFEEKARFASNDASLQELWKTGWRTARLCAGETYFDCPYYEQLQYEGDTRIQALISLYVSGDDRLVRKSITDFYNSRVPEGLPQGRYPSNRLQVIPPYALFWVSMLHDYFMHRPDEDFVKQYLPAARMVLEWYERHIDDNKNMLGPMKWWNFTDWVDAFPGGNAPGADDGNSAIITLQYAYTLKQAAEMFAHFGKKAEADSFVASAQRLIRGTYNNCYDSSRKMLANTPEKNSFSQHTLMMAVLSGAVDARSMQQTLDQLLRDTSLTPATFYFRFYLTRALKQGGRADLYYSELQPWRDMLKIGLTTFAEKPEPTRSDCHAWSASVCYDFLATLCGIEPSAAGFRQVNIAPAPGELKELKASMPHPEGTIEVDLKRSGSNGITGKIVLPGTVTGTFIWNNKTLALKPGSQTVKL